MFSLNCVSYIYCAERKKTEHRICKDKQEKDCNLKHAVAYIARYCPICVSENIDTFRSARVNRTPPDKHSQYENRCVLCFTS